MRVWSYVITTDRGSAPNFEAPAITLTVCRPRIRRSARLGDLVMAFNGRRLSQDPHSIRWAGVVTEVVPLDRYWEDARFRGKRPDRSAVPDNIYRLNGDTWHQVPNTTHDEGNLATDLSGRNALVFGQAWYFGDTQPEPPGVFDLRVAMNQRRNEPLREISDDEWRALSEWLQSHDIGLPVPDGLPDGRCGAPRKHPPMPPKRGSAGRCRSPVDTRAPPVALCPQEPGVRTKTGKEWLSRSPKV